MFFFNKYKPSQGTGNGPKEGRGVWLSLGAQAMVLFLFVAGLGRPLEASCGFTPALSYSGCASGGSLSNSGSNWTLSGNGTHLWSGDDALTFAGMAISGDFTISTQILSSTSTGGSNTKAGLMVRPTTATTTNMVWVGLKPTSASGGYIEAEHEIAGTFSCTAPCNTTTSNYPFWVRMVRLGNVFTSYYSSDGVSWTLFASVTIAMTDPVYVGLFVNGDAPNNTASCTTNNTVVFANTSFLCVASGPTPTPSISRTFTRTSTFTRTPTPSPTPSRTPTPTPNCTGAVPTSATISFYGDNYITAYLNGNQIAAEQSGITTTLGLSPISVNVAWLNASPTVNILSFQVEDSANHAAGNFAGVTYDLAITFGGGCSVQHIISDGTCVKTRQSGTRAARTPPSGAWQTNAYTEDGTWGAVFSNTPCYCDSGCVFVTGDVCPGANWSSLPGGVPWISQLPNFLDVTDKGSQLFRQQFQLGVNGCVVSTPTNTPSRTNSPTNSPTFSATRTMSPTPTTSPTPSSTATFSPTPTTSPTPSATATFSPTPTFSDSPTPSSTPTQSFTFTASPTPSSTATPTPTYTATPTFSDSPTPTATPTSTPTYTPTPTNTPSPTFSDSPTQSFTFTGTNTYTGTRTFTDSPTMTLSGTPTSTFSGTVTFTDSPTMTPSDTPTPTYSGSVTFTDSPTASPTSTESDTYTGTKTYTDSPTDSPTPTESDTYTGTKTFTEPPTLTDSPTETPSFTESVTPSPSRTVTPSRTQSPTFSESPTRSATFTISQTLTPQAAIRVDVK
ncbi:MAG: hypothetical protein V4498_08915, partial [candidate division FCPU426 bacterium]